MTRMFHHKSVGREMLNGAIWGAADGLIGVGALSLLAYSAPLTLGAAATVAGACALGGALVILPIIALEQLVSQEYHSGHPIMYNLAHAAITAMFAFAAGCIGAAILGLAILPMGTAALAGAVALSLLRATTSLILEDHHSADSACNSPGLF